MTIAPTNTFSSPRRGRQILEDPPIFRRLRKIRINVRVPLKVKDGKSKGADHSAALKIAKLTNREREIVTLVAEGLKNKEIAERLFISSATVRHHLSAIFAKLEVSSRLKLVIFALRHGLAELSNSSEK